MYSHLSDQANNARILMNKMGNQCTPFIFIIDFEMLNPLVYPLADVNPESILFSIDSHTNAEIISASSKAVEFKGIPMPVDLYENSFRKVMDHLIAGNSYLINLTQETPIQTNLNLKEIFHRSNARFKLWYKDQFVVFSPESFILTSNNQIFSFPMKGTIDASLTGAEQLIMNDHKEIAEHNTIVDLIRNDLSMVSKQVRVNRFRYIDRIKTTRGELLQISSEITGNLMPDWQKSVGDILFRLLPAGSVTGAPKKKTVEIIHAIENYKRGYYTGVFGIFTGKEIRSAVMIRFIENSTNGYTFKSGGGITIHSVIEHEYAEMIQKVYVPII